VRLKGFECKIRMQDKTRWPLLRPMPVGSQSASGRNGPAKPHIKPMSRAFVREQDVGAFEHLPDRPVSEHPNDVTKEGMAQIEAALAAAREAFAMGQATDDRGAMASASRDLRYWNARRATARIIPDPEDSSQVRFGSTVTIARDDGREQTFRIIGEDEADPSRGTISHVSPLASALLKKGVGDVVRAGAGAAEILAIGC
jgi:transcription elongation GreA/GreB family factor